MSNTIKVKRGAAAPTTSNLEEYELGYSTNEKNLYIRDNNEIIKLSSHIRILPFNKEIFLKDFKINEDSISKENFPYYYNLSVIGVKSSEIPIIIFKPDTTMDASFFSETKEGIITIYANDKTEDSIEILKMDYVILIDTE